MFFGLINDLKFVPTYYTDTVFDVDYIKLYEKGIRLILTDLDNTLISYKESSPTLELYEWIKNRKEEGFEVIIVSNNSHKKRVKYFSEELGIKYTYLAAKPLKFGFRRALRKASRKYKRSEVVAIGDQMMTDVFIANRMKTESILVKAIDRKTEIVTTRNNRRLEKKVLANIKSKYPELYEEKLKKYQEENHGRN
jgi:HAD superfamily phosphatase (TIGR01668 family)